MLICFIDSCDTYDWWIRGWITFICSSIVSCSGNKDHPILYKCLLHGWILYLRINRTSKTHIDNCGACWCTILDCINQIWSPCPVSIVGKNFDDMDWHFSITNDSNYTLIVITDTGNSACNMGTMATSIFTPVLSLDLTISCNQGIWKVGVA